jgi:hypothetical protein
MRVCFETQGGGANANEDWVAGTPTLAVVLDGLSTAGLSTGRHWPWTREITDALERLALLPNPG